MRYTLFLAVILIGTQSLAADMAGDAQAGSAKAAICSACHGADGNGASVFPDYPGIAGQHASYLVSRLKAFKAGTANNPIMAAQAQILSEQDMYNVAAYYASLPAKPGAADNTLVDAGGVLYRLGNEKNETASCAACHGPRGHGNPQAGIPSITGQRALYVINQLKHFADGTRDAGVNGMMHDIAKTMSADDMKAVAAYIQGLH